MGNQESKLICSDDYYNILSQLKRLFDPTKVDSSSLGNFENN